MHGFPTTWVLFSAVWRGGVAVALIMLNLSVAAVTMVKVCFNFVGQAVGGGSGGSAPDLLTAAFMQSKRKDGKLSCLGSGPPPAVSFRVLESVVACIVHLFYRRLAGLEERPGGKGSEKVATCSFSTDEISMAPTLVQQPVLLIQKRPPPTSSSGARSNAVHPPLPLISRACRRRWSKSTWTGAGGESC